MRPAILTLALVACTPSAPEPLADGMRVDGVAIRFSGYSVDGAEQAMPPGPIATRVGHAGPASLGGLAWHDSDITAWWADRRQGWTIHRALGRTIRFHVVVDADLGDVAPRGATWRKDGQESWYTGLTAWDARRNPVEAHLERTERGFDVVAEIDGKALPITIDPIVGVPTSIGTGSQGDQVNGLASADVNGDGDGDVITTISNSKKLYVQHGAATGPSGALETTVTLGSAPYTRSLATGDLTGDGIADVAFGTASGTSGADGTLYVYKGAAAGLDTAAPLTKVAVTSSGDRLGYSNAIGDIDGDGIGDLISASSTRRRVEVYLGGSAMDLVADQTHTESAISGYGTRVGAGDFDGDGDADVVVSDASAYLYFLRNDAGTLVVSHTVAPYTTTMPDNVSFTPCDVTGDGLDDLVVGWPSSSTGVNPAVRVYAGGPISGMTTAWWTITGSGNGRQFGSGVSCLGDISADGRADLAVGEPGYNNGDGRFWWYYAPATAQTYTTPTNAVNWATGSGAEVRGQLMTAGDVDGDGDPDAIFAGYAQYYVYWYGTSNDGDQDGIPYPDDCDDTDAGVGSANGFLDGDGDGFGDAPASCAVPGSTVATGGDCDDSDASVFPGAVEVCDSADDDCDGTPDDGAGLYADLDGDGYGAGSPNVPCSGSGVAIGGDCNDGALGIHPGATETCDGFDQDCDGQIDEGLGGATWYVDADADGFGDSALGQNFCTTPTGRSTVGGDCADGDATVFPGASETCDGDDDDCDGASDEGLPTSPAYPDADGDGVGVYVPGSCQEVLDLGMSHGDGIYALDLDGSGAMATADYYCDMTNGGYLRVYDQDVATSPGYRSASAWLAGVNAGSPESGQYSLLDRLDDLKATDGVWHFRLSWPSGPSGSIEWTQSTNPGTNGAPGTVAIGSDTTGGTGCSSVLFSGLRPGNSGVAYDGDSTACYWFAVGSPGAYQGGIPAYNRGGEQVATEVELSVWLDRTNGAQEFCSVPSGYATVSGDCDDNDTQIGQPSPEVCDGLDNDCDGDADDGLTRTTGYADTDGDAFGDATNAAEYCALPAGVVADATDCDDTDGAVYPGAAELCDGLDNDCDTATDEGVASTWFRDADGDGRGTPTMSLQACTQPSGWVADASDCDDGNAAAYSGASEVCNGFDDDCDGVADNGLTYAVWYPDQDGDGFGGGTGVSTCDGAPGGYVSGFTDCDDADATRNPSATERCDGGDDDCDGFVDELLATATWYADGDGDGFGDPTSAVETCAQPTGFVADRSDCDDTDAAVNPDATEVIGDADDEDCDGIAAQDTGDTAETDRPDDTDVVDTDVVDTDETDVPGDTDVVADTDVDPKCGCASPATSPTALLGLIAFGLMRRRAR